MSGESDIIGEPDARANRPISAGFSTCEMWGVLWGGEHAASKTSAKSDSYSDNWWSRGALHQNYISAVSIS
jgi:hypothetical protein